MDENELLEKYYKERIYNKEWGTAEWEEVTEAGREHIKNTFGYQAYRYGLERDKFVVVLKEEFNKILHWLFGQKKN